MSVLPVGFGSSGRYQIANSVRVRSSASAYFSRTFGTPTLAGTFTFSAWIKRGDLTTYQYLFNGGSTGGTEDVIRFNADNTIQIFFAGATNGNLTSTPLLRDPSGWYHLVLVVEISQGTAANRTKLWVNNQAVALSGTAQTGAALTGWNKSGEIHNLCRHTNATSYHVDGLLSDIYFIDGQALTPSYFGESNTDGVWVPKSYSGTYGTNGFHLDFKDAALTVASNAGLGKDVSGNGNYWTTNNISVTAGVTYDSFTDTPTNNYATLNPLIPIPVGSLSAGNLAYSRGSTASHGSAAASITLPTTGKWYWEVNPAKSTNNEDVGVADISVNPQLPATSSEIGHRAALDYAWKSDGNKWSNNSSASYNSGSTFSSANVIGVAWDSDAGTITFYKDNVSQGVAYSSITQVEGKFAPAISSAETGAANFNFGQRPFTYTPPTGFKALCTANLPTVAITNPKKHFDVNTRSGTGASATKTGLGFQPDLVWVKARSAATDHKLTDAVRGVTKALISDTTGAETTDANGVTAFTSDGYTVGSDTNYNNSTGPVTYVDWLWKGGNGTVSNTSGSITSTVSANVSAGISIVTYTGTGANATVGHGLGVAPKMVIIKARTATAAENWIVYHSTVGNANQLNLNSTAASAGSTNFNSTSPTSTVFSIGSGTAVNENTKTYVAYCFAEIPGFSKFGSYTGNGSADGPFVWCGFRPKFVMVKNTQSIGDWMLYDTSRDTYNVASNYLRPNSSGTEGVAASIDVTAGGFKLRYAGGSLNTAETYIFAAFAEHPMGGSNVAPAPAR